MPQEERDIEQAGGQVAAEEPEASKPVIEVPIGEKIVAKATLRLKWRTAKEFWVIFNVEKGQAGDFEGGRKMIKAPTKETGTFACYFYGREMGVTTVSFSAKMEDRVFAKLEFDVHTVGGSGGMIIDRDRIITIGDETPESMPAEPDLQKATRSNLMTRETPGNMGMNTKNSKMYVPFRKVRLAQNCHFREENAFVKRNGHTKVNNTIPVN